MATLFGEPGRDWPGKSDTRVHPKPARVPEVLHSLWKYRGLSLAVLLIGLLSIALAALVVWRDRQDAIQRAADRASSLSRMVLAHAEAAAAVADRIYSAVEPALQYGDLEDEGKARELASILRRSVGENSVVASAGIISQAGDVIATSRSFPVKPLNVSELPFFQAHAAGSTDPLLMGDPNPGPISGKRRFTFSRAVRNADGSLRAVFSAAIQTDNFDSLYAEASRWPGASTGLFRLGGGLLAESHADPSGEASFPIADLLKVVENKFLTSTEVSGTDFVDAGSETRLASWHRSAEYPAIYSLTSDPVSEVLSSWRIRTFVTSMLVAFLNVILWGFAIVAVRAWEARQQQAVHDLAVREIHHRLKNSLQMLSSLIRMRSSKYDDLETQQAIAEITSDLQAVAEVHTVLQNAPSDKTIEFGMLLQGVCGQFRRLYQCNVRLAPGQPVSISSSNATALSIVINELLTNAMKHGDGRIDVAYHVNDGSLLLDVKNGVTSPPQDPEDGKSNGFGLRAIRAVIDGLGGNLAREVEDGGEAHVRVTVPLTALGAG